MLMMEHVAQSTKILKKKTIGHNTPQVWFVMIGILLLTPLSQLVNRDEVETNLKHKPQEFVMCG